MPKVLKGFEVVSDKPLIKNIEIVREGEFNGFKMSEKVMTGFIKKFKLDKKKNNYQPTVFVGHNSFFGGDERPAVGFIENIRIEGKKMLADLRGNTNDFLEKLREFPYRSIEFTEDRLWGLALLGSNAPAVKTEATTFSENGKKYYLSNPVNQSILLSNNNPKMENFKKFLEEISSKEVITKEDLTKLQKEFNALTEEEQLETIEEVDAIEEKAEEAGVKLEDGEEVVDDASKETEEKVEETDSKEPEEVVEEKVEEKVDEVKDEVKEELSEKAQIIALQEKAKEAQKELSQLRTQVRKEKLQSDVSKFILSEENPVGLPAAFSEKTVDFCANLSEEQAKAFFEIIGEFKSVNFNEEGGAGNGAETDDKEDGFDGAAEKYAEEHGISYAEALKIVTA